MKIRMSKDITQIVKFCFIGGTNTIIGSIGMLILYNWLHLGYLGSSITIYIIGSIYSFMMNKRWTFKSNSSTKVAVVKFFLNIVCCYFITYTLARGIAFNILEKLCKVTDPKLREQIWMIGGQALFAILNYCGQRCFVFYEKTDLYK